MSGMVNLEINTKVKKKTSQFAFINNSLLLQIDDSYN